MPAEKLDEGLRRVVARVALLNLAYFGVEFSVALVIGSVSLFADSIDFLEDTSINFLILIALGWSARHRSHVGIALRRYINHSRPGDALDGLGQVLSSGPAGTDSTHTDRSRRYGCEPNLCPHAGALSRSWR